MEDIVYRDIIDQEKHHWWSKTRREILDSCLSNLNLAENANILGIDCGTGENIPTQKQYGTVKAVEMDTFP